MPHTIGVLPGPLILIRNDRLMHELPKCVRSAFLIAGVLLLLVISRPAVASELDGRWEGALVTPGGNLRFDLTIKATDDGHRALIQNGPEQVTAVVEVRDGNRVRIAFPHFDAAIEASLADGALSGTYRKRRSATEWAELDFTANRSRDSRRTAAEDLPTGRWRVKFSSSSDPAVAVFQTEDDGTHWATILTTLGDYRYLTCRSGPQGAVELSVFDGGHAFLLRGRKNEDGFITGDFWSGAHWHETWQAFPDESAELPDALKLTTAQASVSLSDLHVRTLTGETITLADQRFHGRARVISLFGTWCPNCHDATEFLSEIHELYGADGLSVVGVAFEVSGDFQRDAAQVRIYAERFGVEYPVVLGGIADKQAASESFPLLDAVRAYPTMIFLDSSDRVAAVYTGFSGPATGAAHTRLKDQLHEIIQRLLSADE